MVVALSLTRSGYRIIQSSNSGLCCTGAISELAGSNGYGLVAVLSQGLTSRTTPSKKRTFAFLLCGQPMYPFFHVRSATDENRSSLETMVSWASVATKIGRASCRERVWDV